MPTYKLVANGTVAANRLVSVELPRHHRFITRIYGKGVRQQDIELYVGGYNQDLPCKDIRVQDYSTARLRIKCQSDTLDVYADYLDIKSYNTPCLLDFHGGPRS